MTKEKKNWKRIVIQTEGGTKIDIVHNKRDAWNEYFILYPDIDKVNKVIEGTTGGLTKAMAKKLVSLGLLWPRSWALGG